MSAAVCLNIKSEIKANNAVGDGRMTSYSSCIMLNYNDNEQN